MSSSQFFKLFIILSLVMILLTSCQFLSLDRSKCPIENLLINSSDLPGDHWEEIGSRSYRDAPSKLGSERIGTGFSTPRDGIAGESVYRFGNESGAKDGYIELMDLWHRLEPEDSVWSPLDFPSSLSVAADEYKVECSVSLKLGLRTCWYIARYEKTVIEFRSAMFIVNNDDLFNIIDIFDKKIAICEKS